MSDADAASVSIPDCETMVNPLSETSFSMPLALPNPKTWFSGKVGPVGLTSMTFSEA